jgi:hypothetical protein
LNAKKTGNIALVVGDISNPITARYTKGIEEEAFRNNSSLIICNTGFDLAEEARYFVNLIEKRIDGIIIASSGQRYAYIDEVIARKIPLVFITRKPIEIGAIEWAEDQFKAGRYVPDTPQKAVKTIIRSTQKGLKDRMKYQKVKNADGSIRRGIINEIMRVPQFPK